MKRELTIERRNRLANKIISNGKISVVEAAKEYNVSTETIRKDLIYLEKKGIIIKGHGGAIVASKAFDHPVSTRINENNELKFQIAVKVVEMLSENSTIYLGAGSTQIQIADLIRHMSGFTVVTTSVPVTSILLESDNTIMFVGGKVEKHNKATIGYWAVNALSTMHFDCAILGTSGIKNMKGPSTYSYEEMEVEKEVFKHSNQKIVVCDSSKFETTGIFQFAKWEDIDVMVTNKGTNVGDLETFVEIVYA